LPLISGLSVIAGNYDALLCDVWGVLHNGREAYPGVADALGKFRAKGGHVLLLSNAPRPSGTLPAMFERMGIPHDVYDGILTSGDATKTYLAGLARGARCYYIGPERDAVLFEDTGVKRGGEADAEFILATGPFNDEEEGPEDYREQFTRLAARDLPFICANPDIIVERGGKHIYCAGALAQLYGQLGGEIIYFGKPHLPIYSIARKRLGEFTRGALTDGRILAVGDGPLTDIKGANEAGIDALFITGGIAAGDCGPTPDSPEEHRVARVLERAGIHAAGAMARLVW
tara:strand:+ start:3153 stop:4013 length:861 start_codon:yes stop_codon:yes gene_type:complete